MSLLAKLLSPWLRMGTYARLFVPIFVLIAVVVGVRYTLLIQSESASANVRYQQAAQELADYLDVTLQPALDTADRAALDVTLGGALLLNADLRRLQLDGPAGHQQVQRLAYTGGTAPPWFEALLPLQPLRQQHRLGATLVTLEFTPVLPRWQVWTTVRQQAALSALNIGIIYLLLGILIHVNQRMLARLADATGRFQRGEHQVRLPVRGTLEARALARTFNDMAQQVETLLVTRQQQQLALGAQLARTLDAQQQLRSEKERIAVTLASIGDAVITTDLAGRIDTLIPRAEQLTGCRAEQAQGRALEQVFVLAAPAAQAALPVALAAMLDGAPVLKLANQSLRQPGGQTLAIDYTAAPIRTPHGAVQGAVLVFRDVSEKRQLIQQISWQSSHDVLTGLPNRSALAARFEQELARARAGDYLLAVCLLALDHFQQVNQTLGHAAGNEILKQAASRLHEFAGQRHYAARLGGDEFVLLLPALGQRAAIEQALQGLLAALAHDYRCDGTPVRMSASAGVALYTGNEVSADHLLRHADQALYQAKITGRNRYHFFDADLDEQVRTHHNRRTEVRAALLAGELRLHYQPKLDMRRGCVIGMEALLRWQHPQRGLVPPLEFLPIVEHSELIVDIGAWVIRTALQQLQRWRDDHPHWVVSVNIAARHVQRPDFVARLRLLLAEFPQVPPARLELEILESSALGDIAQVRDIMLDCQQLGIRFALDDFGTGYSSLAYLKRLPANVLKIDQSFVRSMLAERDDLHLVCAVISLARSFGRTVIAEGVETVAHGALLMQLGCDLVQGYGVARPMPAELLPDWLAQFDSAPWQAAAALPAIHSPGQLDTALS
ncbi:MAG: putative bifunctional diguanylate cyclase/phosphodiesterase [Sphingomonadaceae bacterium]